jgi:hypothetical protein
MCLSEESERITVIGRVNVFPKAKKKTLHTSLGSKRLLKQGLHPGSLSRRNCAKPLTDQDICIVPPVYTSCYRDPHDYS